MGSEGYKCMSQKEKFEPNDSGQQRPKANQVVKQAKDRDYQRKEPALTAPALKRKFSEQPPTWHNSKT
ncbi:hypothetical protein GCM10011386_29910 [Parapedobacter defluvii]|uniref:Uncharacterized protein n=2 Tax=Parapedobacter defluvii TaxID=2045106 RepID=A0ABQ1M6X5_9SPHI|nr:hypothetical protein GCM10011386_29910 [Parapedobacter defluvii]